MLVLLAVVIASLFLLPKSRWKDTIEEVAASGVYIENWVLAFKAVDYLAAQATASPVQHFWALSTQGQFYLVWPLLVAGVAFAARKAGVAFRKLAAVAFAIVFAVSLVASVILTQRDQPFTYFNTFARAWEFSLGALLAVFVSRIDLSRGLRVAAGWIGVLGILSCGLVLQVSRVFPGYAALWPILCAALVIIAGTSGSRFGVDRILASKPMVYVGGISYAIYLWHFPLLVFCRTYAQPYPISFATGVGILVASFVLAALTSRFLENPARYSSIGKESPLRAFAFGVACAVPLVIGLGFWSWRYVDARRDMRPPVALGDPQHPGVAALGQAGPQRWKAPLYPGPLEVAQDRDRMESRCGLDYESTVPGQCWAGVTENPRLTVAVVGSSYAAQWTPALELGSAPLPRATARSTSARACARASSAVARNGMPTCCRRSCARNPTWCSPIPHVATRPAAR
jgi:peptidoglycan/LPS O-acetylase OafA/YrhL